MAQGHAVCALLCVLLHVLSAAVLPEQPQLLSQQALVQQKFAHLQGEIDEWKRLGHPTNVTFLLKDGVAEVGYLVDMPVKVTLGETNYAANIFFYLYSRNDPNGKQVPATVADAQSLEAAGWTPNKPTKFVIHGFANNIDSPLFAKLIPALLEGSDCNLIAVDWGKLVIAPFYVEARSHVSGTGKVVAKLIDDLVRDGGMDLNDLHLMGHSLGAHVSGCAGKELKSSGKIGRITGMDPALPLYVLLTSDRLNKADATLVDIIHTCAGLLGLQEAIGDVDFYPNGGHPPQPGCGLDVVGDCSHSRSWELMAESAVEEGAFPSVECDSQIHATASKCSGDLDGNMGMNLEYNENGTSLYYLKTASSSPYDLEAHSRAGGL